VKEVGFSQGTYLESKAKESQFSALFKTLIFIPFSPKEDVKREEIGPSTQFLQSQGQPA